MPQIQEPDDRFWTALRVVFVALSVAGAVYLGTHLFLASPPDSPLDAPSAPPPAPATETP